MIYLETPLTVDKIKQLHAGDEVYLSGTIYTGRDAAHKRLIQYTRSNDFLCWPNTFKTRSSIWQWWTNHFRKNGCLFT